MNRVTTFASIALGVALGLSACDRDIRITKKEKPEVGAMLRTVSRLDCPEMQGDLQRLSAAADGLTCSYAAKDHAEVDLRLVATGGDADAALSPIEAELRAIVPPPPAAPAKPTAEVATDGKENAKVRLPGLSIDAEGDRAQIHVGGIHIDGENNRADISVSGGKGGEFNIQAEDGNATIRQNRTNNRGVRRSLIFATETPTAAGFRVAGYEARGPQAGPLVVAVVRSKGKGDTDYVFKDMKALVAKNVGR